jgi:hypothetical protein
VTSGGSANYPILTKIIYNEWSFLMKIKLEARSLWGTVEKGDVEFQDYVDRWRSGLQGYPTKGVAGV